MVHSPHPASQIKAADCGLVLSSTLHFVLRLSVEGRLSPEGSEVEGRSTAKTSLWFVVHSS